MKNVQAAGRCDIQTRGRHVALVRPRMEVDPLARDMPVPVRQFLRLTGVDHFLWMDVDGSSPPTGPRPAARRGRGEPSPPSSARRTARRRSRTWRFDASSRCRSRSSGSSRPIRSGSPDRHPSAGRRPRCRISAWAGSASRAVISSRSPVPSVVRPSGSVGLAELAGPDRHRSRRSRPRRPARPADRERSMPISRKPGRRRLERRHRASRAARRARVGRTRRAGRRRRRDGAGNRPATATARRPATSTDATDSRIRCPARNRWAVDRRTTRTSVGGAGLERLRRLVGLAMGQVEDPAR